jgi:Animal haem peroxidase
MRKLFVPAAVLTLALVAAASANSANRQLDGGGNNLAHPDWGQAGVPYLRVLPANYGPDGSSMVDGPNPRAISNAIFNEVGVTLFSEGSVSQFGWLWGQFIDHTLGLRDETPAEPANIPFVRGGLETFRNDFDSMQFNRTPAAPGTGTGPTNPRQQINTVNSFIDGWNIYGGSLSRLEWLRDGLFDGDMTNNDAQMVLINGYLPRGDARGSDPLNPPAMDLMGQVTGHPEAAIVAGDVRANENVGLTALTTLFVREHNRIASMVPQTLSEQTRFDIARRVVDAEEQYITYNEFLPAMGVKLPSYAGYDATVNATLSQEFATVGFRGHSAVNGELQAIGSPTQWSATRLQTFENQGIEDSTLDTGQLMLSIPMNVAFGNPGLLPKVGLGALMNGLAQNIGYKNDEQIANAFRSILFQVPGPGVDPASCFTSTPPPDGCFSVVQDLGAIDVQRARDHGLPTYNQLRAAYGLPVAQSFTDITGESSESLNGLSITDPAILDFLTLLDVNGNPIPLGSEAIPVSAIRGSTLAARLKAIYGSVNKVDAFVGMVCEPHLAGSEMGALQNAIWTKQFVALRDGDRFFYGNDPTLATIRNRYGIDFRHTLAEIINLNTSAHVQPDVFHGTIAD